MERGGAIFAVGIKLDVNNDASIVNGIEFPHLKSSSPLGHRVRFLALTIDIKVFDNV